MIYDTITPAGALLSTQCTAIGHDHTGPDVPLRLYCQVHDLEWVWCAGCGTVWCPGELGGHQPHEGSIKP